MKAMVVYFSGTGNTRMITEEIIAGLRRRGWDAESVSIEALDAASRDFNFKLRTMDLLGFGFPVYKFSYPEIMNSIFPFLSNLRPARKPFFVYSTYCRFASNALHRFASDLEQCETAESVRRHVPVAMRAFKSPSNGIASLQAPESREYSEVMYFSPGIDKHIEAFLSEIDAGVARYYKDGSGLRHHGGPVDQFRENLVGKIEHARYPFMTIDRERCTVCGLCARQCPDSNLFLSADDDEDRRIIIRDAENCLHCLRCLHICPYRAISFGPLVHGPSRYRPAVRKALYQQAVLKSASERGPGTRLSRMKWALGNFRYYMLKKHQY